jgi:hypothetical protein
VIQCGGLLPTWLAGWLHNSNDGAPVQHAQSTFVHAGMMLAANTMCNDVVQSHCVRTGIPVREGFVKVADKTGAASLAVILTTIVDEHLNIGGNGARWRCGLAARRLLWCQPHLLRVAMAPEPVGHLKAALQHSAHIWRACKGLQVCRKGVVRVTGAAGSGAAGWELASEKQQHNPAYN